jgi:NAD(P)-dependent dehydrogenase (short-subunit alcohol dehydrogenase family)
VHVCDIDGRALDDFRRSHASAMATRADAQSAQDVEAVFAAQQDCFGGLDVLINNVGIAGPTGPIEEISTADWERTVDVNLNAQFRFTHCAVPMLRQSEQAQILCMSSVAGRLGYALRTPYAATKWAIVGLVKSLAIELGPDDIRVNALLPGPVEGPRMDGVIRARAADLHTTFEEMRGEYLKKIALGRMVEARDVAALAIFLCSPAARNISGQAISVDGSLVFL